MSRTIKKFVLAHDQARRGVGEFAMVCDEGAEVVFQKAKRTLDQNALMWELLGQIAAQIEWCGLKLTPEDYKDIISAGLLGQRTVPNMERSGFVVLGRRTSEMSKQDLSDMIEMCYLFGAQNGVTFTDVVKSK
jgi:NinB protein